MATLSDKLLNPVGWQPIELEHGEYADLVLPRTTHSGLIKADEFELRCYKLSDGHICFDFEDIEGFLRGCLHCMTPGPCQRCHPDDDSTDRIRLAVVLGSDDSEPNN
jgi:hypothetical protein